ncbi:MAG: hydrogenase 4 subunit B, partial [Enterobacterales bacterium]|nr:hydrogenase 4 subunit B [Enterobacterales bacterium]
MDSLHLLFWSVGLYVIGAVLSLLFARQERIAIWATGISAILGGIIGLCSAFPVLIQNATLTFSTAGPFPFAEFVVRMDPLAAFMVLVISLLVTLCGLYSLSYVEEYRGRGAWS